MIRRVSLSRPLHIEYTRPLRCYVRGHTGELIQLEINTLVRLNELGHRISTNSKGQSISQGTGWDSVYACIAKASCISSTNTFPDKKATSARAFRAAAGAYYNSPVVIVTRA